MFQSATAMALPGTWNAIKATLSADEDLGGAHYVSRIESH